MHILFRLGVILTLTCSASAGARPKQSIRHACLRALLTIPVWRDPVGRALLNLNFEAIRLNGTLLSERPEDPAAVYRRDFEAGIDARLAALKPELKIKLITRLLDYDELNEPERTTEQGYWDNPLRIQGTFASDPDEFERKPLAELNSRELLEVMSGLGTWAKLRIALTYGLLDRLQTILQDHPDQFVSIFAAYASPLIKKSDVSSAVLFQRLGTLLTDQRVILADKRLALETTVSGLRAAITEKNELRAKLSWRNSEMSGEESAATTYLKKRLANEGQVLLGAVAALNELGERVR